MDFFLVFLGVLWLAFRVGREDGKWGWFIFLFLVILIGFICALID